MCQLRHPNIVSADDVYLSTDIAPSAIASSATRAQDLFVRMPYYPADLAWLIHSSPQVLTSAHIQVRQRVGGAAVSARTHERLCCDAVHFGPSAVWPAVIAGVAARRLRAPA
jgi:hypothetical protein